MSGDNNLKIYLLKWFLIVLQSFGLKESCSGFRKSTVLNFLLSVSCWLLCVVCMWQSLYIVFVCIILILLLCWTVLWTKFYPWCKQQTANITTPVHWSIWTSGRWKDFSNRPSCKVKHKSFTQLRSQLQVSVTYFLGSCVFFLCINLKLISNIFLLLYCLVTNNYMHFLAIFFWLMGCDEWFNPALWTMQVF